MVKLCIDQCVQNKFVPRSPVMNKYSDVIQNQEYDKQLSVLLC
jgi:hypothetical protein